MQIEVRSRDAEAAREVVGKFRDALSAEPGIIDIRDDRFALADEVQIRLTPQGRAYGVTLAQLAAEIRANFFGSLSVHVQRDREEIDVRVRLPEAERGSMSAVRKLRVPVNGGYIPLSHGRRVYRAHSVVYQPN